MNETEARSRKAMALARAWHSVNLPARELEIVVEQATLTTLARTVRANQARTSLRLCCELASQLVGGDRAANPWPDASPATWAETVQLVRGLELEDQHVMWQGPTGYGMTAQRLGNVRG